MTTRTSNYSMLLALVAVTMFLRRGFGCCYQMYTYLHCTLNGYAQYLPLARTNTGCIDGETKMNNYNMTS